MKKIFLLAFAAIFAVSIVAQTKIRIWMGDAVAFEQSVTQIDSVTFVLDNSESVPHGVFSVSPTKKVRFSKGNLQFNPGQGTHQCADGSTQQGTWRFADVLPLRPDPHQGEVRADPFRQAAFLYRKRLRKIDDYGADGYN